MEKGQKKNNKEITKRCSSDESKLPYNCRAPSMLADSNLSSWCLKVLVPDQIFHVVRHPPAKRRVTHPEPTFLSLNLNNLNSCAHLVLPRLAYCSSCAQLLPLSLAMLSYQYCSHSNKLPIPAAERVACPGRAASAKFAAPTSTLRQDENAYEKRKE
jgi:hypothetical protein